MKVHFVRHGKTPSNALGRIMSRTNDESLSEEGLAEVVKVVSETSIEYDLIISSPLRRAHETAQEFAKKIGKKVILHDDLMEQDFGTLSNKTWEETSMLSNGVVSKENWHTLNPIDFHVHGGETHTNTVDRITAFIDYLKENHPNSKPLIVTHGGVLRVLYSMHPHIPPRERKNVSFHEFEI